MSIDARESTPLDGVPAAVERRLTEHFATLEQQANDISPAVAAALDHLRAFVLRGGKRIRPTFAWVGWTCALQSVDPHPALDDSDIMTLGAALELVQACALIHDDIIDESDTRRGHPTVHRSYEKTHRDAAWHGDAGHFGASAAILIGDLALAWADDLVATLPTGIAPAWSAMRTEVLGGQLLDIVNEAAADESVQAALTVITYKTAAYTVARPLQLGAALGGAAPAMAEELRRIGVDLGIAFQLRDDMLGVFGDPAVTGKPSGDDLAAGKRTVLLAEGLARADQAAAAQLRASVGVESDAQGLERARTILRDVGAVDAVERRIDELLERSVDAITALATGDAARADLITVANRIAYRDA